MHRNTKNENGIYNTAKTLKFVKIYKFIKMLLIETFPNGIRF